MRSAVAFVVFTIVLGATVACEGGSGKSAVSSPTPAANVSPTPEVAWTKVLPTPIVEVLAPPPGIDTSGWQVYRDAAHGFELKYPANGVLKEHTHPGFGDSSPDNPGSVIDLPIAPNTNLENKHVFIRATDAPAASCTLDHPNAIVRLQSTGIQFWREYNPGGTMMHSIAATTYRTSHSGVCITIDMPMISVSPGAFSTPPPTYDREAESAVFPAILATFRWLD